MSEVFLDSGENHLGGRQHQVDTSDPLENFYTYLLSARLLAGGATSRFSLTEARRSGKPLQKLWQAVEISAHDLADEVARFFELPRIPLAELMSAASLADRFSQRFLRESNMFPQLPPPKGRVSRWPTRPMLQQSAPLKSFLAHRCKSVSPRSKTSPPSLRRALRMTRKPQKATSCAVAPTTMSKACAILRAARPWCAPSTTCSNVPLTCARPIFTSNRFSPALSCGCVSTVSCARCRRRRERCRKRLISRVKILAGLNIAERRLPQDGAARQSISGVDVDIRVATMPTQHGEAAVLRLLPKDRGLLDIGKLGIAPADEARITRLLRLPHGMIVITGPTGSGKTTTLATMLSILNDASRKILTIEDPVEYEIHGINQSQVKPAIGLTFAAALRAFLRQDPDVIMVGEIRDSETAHIAVHAALTGHLVLTTLHTETASSAIPRLLDLGVEGFLLASTLRGVIAQRLVRILCDRCKRSRGLDKHDLAADPRYAALGFTAGEMIFESGGCDRCSGSGYRGRNGVFEVVEVDEDVRRLIGKSTHSADIERAALANGMTTMLEDAVRKCRAGTTSPAEALRVVALR